VSGREEFFRELHDSIRDGYLAEPGSPYRMSGRSKGKERWEETRRCVCEAIDRDGDFLDVGCANGLLLETLREWSPHEITPHGVDFVAELIDHARARHSGFAANFHRANAWDWDPSRRYTFVRTSIECVPEADWPELIRRQAAWAEPLIVCHYRNANEPAVDVTSLVESCGYEIAGSTQAPGVRVTWLDC